MPAPSDHDKEGRLVTWIKSGHQMFLPDGFESHPASSGAALGMQMDAMRPDRDASTIALMSLAKRRWQLVAGIVGFVMTLSLLASLLIPKQYTATADILITPRASSVVQLQQGDVSSNTESTFVDNQVEILKSNTLMGRLVDKLNLTQDPEFADQPSNGSWSLFGSSDPQTGETSSNAPAALPAANAPTANAEASANIPNGTAPAVAVASSVQQQPTVSLDATAAADAEAQADLMRAQAADRLSRKKIKISRVGLTYVVEVSATSRSPERAAQLANELVDLYLVDQLDTSVDNQRRTAAWLQTQLAELGAKLQASQQAAEAFRAANNLQSSNGTSFNDQQRTQLNAQMILARSELVAKETRLREITAMLRGGGNIENVSEVLSSNVIADLRTRQADASKQEADLRSRYGELHPALVKVRAQIRDIESQIQAEANRILSSLNSEVKQAQARVGALNGELSSLDRQAGTNNQASIQLSRLQADVDTNQHLYDALLEGSKKSSVLSDTGSVEPPGRVTARAEVPIQASFPKPILFLAVGFLLSIGCSAAVVGLLEVFDRGYRSTDRAEEHLGVPALATLPLVTPKELEESESGSVSEYLGKRPMSAFAESLRKMRASLNFSNIDNPPRAILVTSSLPNEGKTTLACSLAGSLALSGFKTLLIDCDLRHPSVAKALGATPKSGIVDVLSGQMTLEQAAEKLGYQRPDVLYCTSQSANSADLLDSSAMLDLIATAKNMYDYVVVDSPPVLPIVDPTILARKLDTVVFSVRWDQTPRDASALALRRLLDAEARVAGFVLNAVDVAKMARTSISHGDEYYYYGKYSEYYGKKGEAA